jgi:acyl-CoA hydrolase
MEVGIKVVAESVTKKNRRHAMTCYFTMVALGADGKPAEVPKLVATDEASLQRQKAAELRRQLRREVEQRYQNIKKSGVDTTG